MVNQPVLPLRSALLLGTIGTESYIAITTGGGIEVGVGVGSKATFSVRKRPEAMNSSPTSPQPYLKKAKSIENTADKIFS